MKRCTGTRPPREAQLEDLLLYTSLETKAIAHQMGMHESSAKMSCVALYRKRGVAGRIELMCQEILRLKTELARLNELISKKETNEVCL